METVPKRTIEFIRNEALKNLEKRLHCLANTETTTPLERVVGIHPGSSYAKGIRSLVQTRGISLEETTRVLGEQVSQIILGFKDEFD